LKNALYIYGRELRNLTKRQKNFASSLQFLTEGGRQHTYYQELKAETLESLREKRKIAFAMSIEVDFRRDLIDYVIRTKSTSVRDVFIVSKCVSLVIDDIEDDNMHSRL
jgi:hypothetical protein